MILTAVSEFEMYFVAQQRMHSKTLKQDVRCLSTSLDFHWSLDCVDHGEALRVMLDVSTRMLIRAQCRKINIDLMN